MSPAPRLALSWSGGKDSALALHALRASGIEPSALLTTLTEDSGEITLHRVPRALVQAQAEAAGVARVEVTIPFPCPDEVYARRMAEALREGPLVDVDTIAFGDLFLADIRAFREERLAQVSRRAVFPLWGQPTDDLARRFVDEGFRAIVCAVDTEQVPAGLVGRSFDHAFLDDLPPGVDPCGENGEFHTFVSEGPVFSRPVPVRVGEVRDGGRFVTVALTPG